MWQRKHYTPVFVQRQSVFFKHDVLTWAVQQLLSWSRFTDFSWMSGFGWVKTENSLKTTKAFLVNLSTEAVYFSLSMISLYIWIYAALVWICFRVPAVEICYCHYQALPLSWRNPCGFYFTLQIQYIEIRPKPFFSHTRRHSLCFIQPQSNSSKPEMLLWVFYFWMMSFTNLLERPGRAWWLTLHSTNMTNKFT